MELPVTFNQACAALESAKDAERRAAANRIAREQAVLSMLPAMIEGSKTYASGEYKVTTTFGVNRTIDAAALAAIRSSMPPALFEQAVTYKPALILEGLRYLQRNEPEVYAQLAEAITSKPAKPSVRVERVDVKEAA